MSVAISGYFSTTKDPRSEGDSAGKSVLELRRIDAISVDGMQKLQNNMQKSFIAHNVFALSTISKISGLPKDMFAKMHSDIYYLDMLVIILKEAFGFLLDVSSVQSKVSRSGVWKSADEMLFGKMFGLWPNEFGMTQK